MAGAIALDLREMRSENVFAFASVRCIRIFVLHSFLCHSLVLYSPARCIYQGLLGSIPGRACGLPGRGVFLAGT